MMKTLMGLTGLISFFSPFSAHAEEFSCDRYFDITHKVVDLYRDDPFLTALGVQMSVEMGTRRTEGRLASSIKENHNRHWFRGADKVIIALGIEMCELGISEDAFAIVACHEVGHAIGGPPYYGGSGKHFKLETLVESAEQRDGIASSEGQADYWATSHCMPSVLESEDNISWVKTHPIDEKKYAVIIRDCAATYGKDTQAAARCLRIAVGSTELSHAMQRFGYAAAMERDAESVKNGGGHTLPKKDRIGGVFLPQPDEYMERKAPQTLYNKYPYPQCRLDTYIAGALCPIDFHTPIDHEAMEKNSKLAMKNGACILEGPYPKGARPECWFNEARSIYGKATIPGYTPPVKKKPNFTPVSN